MDKVQHTRRGKRGPRDVPADRLKIGQIVEERRGLLKLVSLERATKNPPQWNGITACGRIVLIRWRWGRLEVWLGPNDALDLWAWVRGEVVYDHETPRPKDEKELAGLLASVFAFGEREKDRRLG